MLKKILLSSLILSSTMALANKDDVVKSLTPFFKDISAENISSTNFKGVYEVINRNPIETFYVSENGRYLIQGDVIDLLTRSKMGGSDKVGKLKKELLDSIPEQDKIIFKAANEKYSINVFTDVDCPFCKKLHQEMGKMNKLGITVKYLASPLASLHPKAQAQMEKIWCANDKVAAMDNYKKNRIIPNSKACKNPVAAQLKIAAQLGVNGTPAIFLSDGTHIPGYLPAAQLIKRVESAK
jgi:thiol:disulfide interchange protein DsbC